MYSKQIDKQLKGCLHHIIPSRLGAIYFKSFITQQTLYNIGRVKLFQEYIGR